jgi:hypothetical protein
MALIIEDGSRPTGANAYVSTATADAYHLARSNAAWASATTAQKETAILEATLYLNGLSWRGRKVESRIMAWPRLDVVDGDGYELNSNIVPDAVAHACCEIAGEIIGGADPLAVQERQINQMTVGSVAITYDQGSPQTPKFPAATALLRGLVWGQNSIGLVRA